MNKQTLKQAGYRYIRPLGDGEHLLQNLATVTLEVFFKSNNPNKWGIKFKNLSLEFGRKI